MTDKKNIIKILLIVSAFLMSFVSGFIIVNKMFGSKKPEVIIQPNPPSQPLPANVPVNPPPTLPEENKIKEISKSQTQPETNKSKLSSQKSVESREQENITRDIFKEYFSYTERKKKEKTEEAKQVTPTPPPINFTPPPLKTPEEKKDIIISGFFTSEGKPYVVTDKGIYSIGDKIFEDEIIQSITSNKILTNKRTIHF